MSKVLFPCGLIFTPIIPIQHLSFLYFKLLYSSYYIYGYILNKEITKITLSFLLSIGLN